ncbi:hypothetical protein Esti_004437 [Eimeria stiedai]
MAEPSPVSPRRGSPSFSKEEARCTDTPSSSRLNLNFKEASKDSSSSSSSSASNGGSSVRAAAAKKPQRSPSADSGSEDVIIISPPSRIGNNSSFRRRRSSPSSSSSSRRPPHWRSRRSSNSRRRCSTSAATGSRRRVSNGKLHGWSRSSRSRSKSSSSSIRRRSSSIRRRSSSIRRGSISRRRSRRSLSRSITWCSEAEPLRRRRRPKYGSRSSSSCRALIRESKSKWHGRSNSSTRRSRNSGRLGKGRGRRSESSRRESSVERGRGSRSHRNQRDSERNSASTSRQPTLGESPPRQRANPLFAAHDIRAYARETARPRPRSRSPRSWTHDRFVVRSPSPRRRRPDGPMWDTRLGQWKSRAGGVYIPPTPEEVQALREQKQQKASPSRQRSPSLPQRRERGSPVYD